MRFYRDLLGFEVGGVTFNTGVTQEVLDNLFNDTCRVTEMVPVSQPPHIEFLDYKTPPGGRPMPVDTKANDLWHWQTIAGYQGYPGGHRSIARGGRTVYHPGRGDDSRRRRRLNLASRKQ